MNNLFLKKKLTIQGSGGGGKGGQSAPPPDVTQYPAVLAPPQFSNLNTINSFSYAEIIDLISDGPIDGLINKNGKKVYDENIFEGIFLNDTPIKETSSEKRQSIPISFLKDKLKAHWNINTKLTISTTKTTVIPVSSIDDINFTTPISIASYHPSDSVFQFIKSLNGSFDAVSLISKAFDLSPIINERPFLTKINIPKFTINLSKEKFDVNEGGADSPSPLKIGMTDLSNYVYFSIGSETLNSFNYFELPRSFISNNSSTIAGKKTFKKNLVSSADYYKYEVYDLNLYIWSIYNEEVGIKNIDEILDRYFNNIYVFQNDFSLFNYNLVQSEFKNGSEVQAPLKYFTNVEIDTEYGKELVGPFKICNCFNPSGAFDNGGIQRVKSFGTTNSYTLPAITTSIECETSDDIRYVQSWPIEYDCKGAPYLICNTKLNYTQFDKTSSSRTAQEAVPITHYIANENVEEVFVSLSVQQLYDTNHVDIVSDNTNIYGAGKQAKLNETSLVPQGINTYGDVVGFNNSLGYTIGNIYLLIYGSSYNNGYVLDGIKTTQTINDSLLVCNLQRVTCSSHSQTLYYNAISNDGLASKVPILSFLLGNGAGNTYCATIDNGLLNYQIPNDSYIIKESFNINGFSTSSLESKLKLLNEDQTPLYCYGLAANEVITSSSISEYVIPATSSSISTYLSNLTKAAGYSFYIATISYRTAAYKELAEKATVAHIINHYIDWDSIIYKSGITSWIANPSISQINYPNIFKYIINPFLNLNQAKYGISAAMAASFEKTIIGNLYLIGINGSYLRSQISFFTNSSLTFLKLDILDQLLEEFLLVTDQSSNFKNVDSNLGTTYIGDYSTTKALENSLLKFQNGKLIGSSSIYNLKRYTISSVPYEGNINSPDFDKNKVSAARDTYNINNIFLYRNQYISINADDKNYDVIFYYNLYSNISQNSTLTPDNSKVTYVNVETNNDGSQSKYPFDASSGSTLKQNITAGTKLPTIVVVDVETGYEYKEKEIYRGACEYFAYRYSIFGMATDSAVIDLGRKSYSFVNACKMSLDRGGYVSKYRNIYSENQPLFLFELKCCSATTSITNYYLVNKKDIYIGDINLNAIECSIDYCISYIVDGSSNIGSQQIFEPVLTAVVNGATLTSNNINTINANFTYIIGNLKNYLLTCQQVSDFFNCNFLCLDLAKSISYLRSPNGITNDKLILDNSFTVESYICSSSVSSQNICYFDTYVYKYPTNSECLQLKIYNYCYTAYETVFIDPTWRATVVGGVSYYNYTDTGTSNGIEESQILNFAIYVDDTSRMNSISSVNTILKYKYPNDLILAFDGFFVRFSNSIIQNTDLYEAFKLYYPNVTLLTTDSKLITSESLKSDFKSQLINKSEYITLELQKKQLLNSLNLLITPEYLSAALDVSISYLNYITSLKVTNTLPPFWIGRRQVQKTINTFFNTKNTNNIQIKAIDKRTYLGSLTIKDPISINANFYTIWNKTTKKLTIIFKKPTRTNLYSELNSLDASSFKLNDFLDGSKMDSSLTFKSNYYYILGDKAPVWTTLHTMRQDVFLSINKSYPIISTIDNNELVNIFYRGATFEVRFLIFNPGNNDAYQVYGYLSSDKDYPFWENTNIKEVASDYYYVEYDGHNHYSYFGFNYKYFYKSGSINTFNYDLNKNVVLQSLVIDCPTESDILKYTEKAFIENGFLPPDMRFFSYENYPYYKRNYTDEIHSWFSDIGISNISYNTKNTFANDSGVTIQIPPAKNDQYGNPMRRYVKITRKSHETLSPLIGKKIALNKVTEIIPQKFSYPFSSIVGTKIDSRAFSQVPTRTFHCKLKKILVPSNYFPNNEDEEDVRYLEGKGKYKIYNGDWNGTFKLAWSNNPAWILMDLLINKRYGLGNYIESDQVDIWELYKISRWCDCVDDNGYYYGVSDGYGGVEPRHSFNALISDKFNIFDMVNQVASVFRGHVYYMNSLITFDDDRIKPIIGEFNNSDVKDGLFNYTNHKKDDEFTAVDISYIDAKDNYKPKIEYVEDSDGIRQRGILKKVINAFGVTSKAQARRFGKYFLYQTSKENSNISFTTDNKALLYKPGDLIRINDELINSIKNFGQIKEIKDICSDKFSITIDKILDSGIYNVSEISLYIPVAKPKYDDYYANAQFVPSNLIFCTSSPILGSLKTTHNGYILSDNGTSYNGIYYKSISAPYVQFNMNEFDTSNPVKSFSGITSVTYTIQTASPVSTLYVTKNETGFLTYIPNRNINNESSKYGYWQFTTGLDGSQDKLIFDVLQDESLKYQLPYKNYFFEYFDTGRYLRYSGVNELDTDFYNTIDFNPKVNSLWVNLQNDSAHTGSVIKNSLSCFSISCYKDPVITYSSVIENDRPSIDTFYILGYTTGSYIYNDEVYNEYTEICLTKSGKSPDNFSFNQIKSSVAADLCKLSVGSNYSLNLLNKRDKIYKVMSITENYVNEYNVIASEYNLNKFKEIEDNSDIDNLQNTFNFLTAQSQAFQTEEKDKLAAPIITSLRYVSNLKALEIKWNSVENAESYDIYIQTPSKQTSNFTTKAYYSTDYNKNISSFLKIWYLPVNSEVGTYTVSIQSNAAANVTSSYKFSPLSKRSINILNY